MTRKMKYVLGTLFITGLLFILSPQKSYADQNLPSSEQVIVSPAQQAVIDALTNANTQVMEAAGASSALDQAVTNANIQITEANATSTTINTSVTIAQIAVDAIQPAIETIINSSSTTTYQNSEIVQSAQQTIVEAQIAVSAIQSAVTTAQTEIAQATNARNAITSIITDANAQVYQANQAIATAQSAVNALESTISNSHTVLANIDDAGVRMTLPFDLLMGNTLYHDVYVGSNAVITFGTNQGYYYWATPDAPSISVGGYDWTTWSQGSGITYSTTETSLNISWDVRPFPQMDFSTVVNQLRFSADVNPTTGAWIADVTGTGPDVGYARWNYRETNNGTITQITDTDLSQGVAGHIGQGNYIPVPINPNTPDLSIIQNQIANANQTIFGLQYMVTSVASNIGTDTTRYNALPAITATTEITNANNKIVTLNETITSKINDLTDIVDQLALTPPPPLINIEMPPVDEAPTPVDEAPLTVEELTDIIDNLISDGTISEKDAQSVLDALSADGEITSDEINNLSDVLSADGKFTDAEKSIVADALIEQADGEAIKSQDIKDAGLTYNDLPPETPVEVRKDEKGNEVIIIAEVAASLQLLDSPSDLLNAVFTNPAEALNAIGNIGADMSPQEREEATKMVVATVIASGAAINAVNVAQQAAQTAAGTSTRTGGTPSSPKGGGTGGGPASAGESKLTRRRKL
jgi:hypothetical protein